MNAKEKNPTQTQTTKAPESEGENRSGSGAIRKVGGAIYTASGIKYAKKNIDILKNRASFPLLRKVVKDELKTSKGTPKLIDKKDISDEDIDRSYFWHTIIIAITGPALIWSIFILTKSLAIGIKFGVWSISLNQGLYTSIPMIIFTASKLYISWHSRKAFKDIKIQLKRES